MNPLRNSKATISPAVITSRPAQKDVQNIGLRHDEMVTGINLHNIQVGEYNTQKAAALQAEQTMKAEVDKEKRVADTETQKMALDHALKVGELDLKRQSLTTK